MGDQPGNIAYLVHTADVAFELVEVRTGAHGLKPLYASGKTPTGTLDAFRTEFKQVLDDMAGEVGARKRANARRMQGSLAKAWNDDGPARRSNRALRPVNQAVDTYVTERLINHANRARTSFALCDLLKYGPREGELMLKLIRACQGP